MFKRYKAFRARVREEFLQLTAPLLAQEQVRRLDDHPQHLSFTRLRHSLDVAWLSFWLTRILGWNSSETCRAALLHDLFFHAPGQHCMSLMRSHPELAVENARKICALTPREENIIRRHMFLGATLTPPRYREGYVVTLVDKYCTSREIIISLCSKRRRRAVYEL